MTTAETLEQAQAVAPSRRRSLQVLLAILVAVGLSAAALVVRADRADPGPFAFEDLGVSATTRVVPAAQAQRAVDALGEPGRVYVPLAAEGSLVVGRLSYTVPPGSTGWSLALILTDAVNHTSTTDIVGAGPTADDAAARFWDGRLAALATRHSWLSGIGDKGDASSGFSSDAMALALPARGPLTFAARLPPDGALGNGVTLTLVLTDDQGEVQWVERLP